MGRACDAKLASAESPGVHGEPCWLITGARLLGEAREDCAYVQNLSNWLGISPVFLAAFIASVVAVARFGLSKVNQAFDGLDQQTDIVLGVSAIVALICSA